MQIESLYQIYLQNPVVTTDSRACPEGSIFFALKGENFNGNKFAASALEKGCKYAVIDEKEFAVNEQYILVENVLETLQQLAKYHRLRLGLPVIGITGTNGKTTTKELVSTVLSKKYNTLYTQSNFNNHIGVPLTLLRLTSQHEMAVIEMGASHPGEIKELAAIACPSAGIVTNVGKAHLEGFGSLEGVIKTKRAMYDYVMQHNGMVFVNAGNSYLTDMVSGYQATTYSLVGKADVEGKILENNPFITLEWHSKKSGFQKIRTHFVGTYNAENMLAAITVGLHFEVDIHDINEALSVYRPSNNRSQFVETQKNKLIIDAYNANPTSMEAAIKNFSQMTVPDKMLILGDMLELGTQSKNEHQHIIDLLQQNKFQNVVLIGKEFSECHPPFKTYPNVNDCITDIEKNPITDKTVLIKGSHGISLEKLIPYL